MPPENTLRKVAHDNAVYDPATEMNKIQYWQFHNQVVAENVAEFSYDFMTPDTALFELIEKQ